MMFNSTYYNKPQNKKHVIQVGKVVCVGRNFAAHAKELNNPVPDTPILFMKPNSALVSFDEPIAVSSMPYPCHFELEIACLIQHRLTCVSAQQARDALLGVGLAFDLTFRSLQSELKNKGYPWERAKSFDGACPISHFYPYECIDRLSLQLIQHEGQDKRIIQAGHVSEMLFSIPDLISEISQTFTLEPGDIVLTGTPAGVGVLEPNTSYTASLYENDLRIFSQPISIC